MWNVIYNGKVVARVNEEWEAQEEMVNFMWNEISSKIDDEYGWIDSRDPFEAPEHRDVDYDKLAKNNNYFLEGETWTLYIEEEDEEG